MSNSIWKKPYDYNYGEDEAKEDAIIVDIGNEHYRVYQDFYDMPHHCDDPDCCFADTECWKRWAKVTDLVAQADKAEQLQKAVDLALNWLHTIATAHHPTTTYYNLDAQTAIDEIKQLIKGNRCGVKYSGI